MQALLHRKGAGRPLDPVNRSSMESRFGEDFGNVRIHTDGHATETARWVGALAYTLRSDIFFAAGRYRPWTRDGRRLLAHELAHVIQQGGAAPADLRVSEPGNSAEWEADRVGESVARALEADPAAEGPAPRPLAGERPVRTQAGSGIQRRLLVTGQQEHVDTLIALLEPATGLALLHIPDTLEITVIGEQVDPASSPALRDMLTTVIDDPVQDAEVHVGRGQHSVTLGAFPLPKDFTGDRVQEIDIGDVLAIEAGAPGSGVAKLAHEIVENYHAHGLPSVPGTSRFEESHEEGVAVENRVAEELVGPGERVAEVTVPGSTADSTEVVTRVQDFEEYYLLYDVTKDMKTLDFSISNARRAPRANVSTRTIDGFAFALDVVPDAGRPTIDTVAAELAANPTATVRIEGFTDSVGAPAENVELGRRRAEKACEAIKAAGVELKAGRFHLVGRGAIDFVADNDSPTDRALNRRVVITVDRPDL
jgi:outer membrane protein OmpA-like peptidoglycan-associated protein